MLTCSYQLLALRSLFCLDLSMHKSGIYSIESYQLLMIALLDKLSLLQDEDAVSMFDC